jgi:DNA-binding winged helix-turn-helix (wHTH) protein
LTSPPIGYGGERIVLLERRLLLLVERKGALVSREEISRRLWGADVFVDVDLGINTAVRKVRTALRDDPEKPRFVETVVGKGYRFAAPVAVNGENTPTNRLFRSRWRPLPMLPWQSKVQQAQLLPICRATGAPRC